MRFTHERRLISDNFVISVFVEENEDGTFTYNLPKYNGGYFNMIDICYLDEKEGDIHLGWDNFNYFVDLDKYKKIELKEDLVRKDVFFKGWFKELKKLIKHGQELGLLPLKETEY